jgi:hypothetical protein
MKAIVTTEANGNPAKTDPKLQIIYAKILFFYSRGVFLSEDAKILRKFSFELVMDRRLLHLKAA